MNKTEKIKYQRNIEKYIESRQVPELFEYLMNSLIKERPEDPISFIISRLENPERIFYIKQ